MLFNSNSNNKRNKNKKKGFTLAEALTILVILGVIAVIALPIILGNQRKIETEMKLKQTYSTLNNAVTKAISANGPINTWDNVAPNESNLIFSKFFTEYLQPHLSLAKPAQVYKLKDLGYEQIIANDDKMAGNAEDSRAMAVLSNGITIVSMNSAHYYSKIGDNKTRRFISVDLGIDINGPKGVNTVGIDIFYYTLYLIGMDQRFEMSGYSTAKDKVNWEEFDKYWEMEIKPTEKDDLMDNCYSSGMYCGALIQKNGWQFPKDYPYDI